MSAARHGRKRARAPLVLRIDRPSGAPKQPRHKLISAFHSLLRRKQQLEAASDSVATAAELAAVDAELEDLGGLQWYQRMSVKGERRGGGGGGAGFTTAKWVMDRLSGKEMWREALAEVRTGRRRKRQRRDSAILTHDSVNNRPNSEQQLHSQQEDDERKEAEETSAGVTLYSPATPPLPPPASSARRPRLLDVGSLNNPYQPYSHLLDLLPIDLNPQHPSVQRMDFFALSSQPHTSHSFDAVILSLVLNFVPSAVLRGRMLRRSARMLRQGGWMYCVLPAACVNNSRWVDETVVRDVWRRCGFRVSEVHYSSKLVFIEATPDDSGEDAGEWKGNTVRQGGQHNNFSIALEAAARDTGETTAVRLDDEDDTE